MSISDELSHKFETLNKFNLMTDPLKIFDDYLRTHVDQANGNMIMAYEWQITRQNRRHSSPLSRRRQYEPK